jgi:8-oxo-dGTP pyrophosphatase MutT (NUDIX family)
MGTLLDLAGAPEPYTACAILISADLSHVPAVSRRGNYADLGLAGGKLEPSDKSLVGTVLRELLEETGIEAGTVPVFHRPCPPGGLYSCTFQVTAVRKWPAESFPFVRDGTWVGWVPRERIAWPECSFGIYNQALFKTLGL